MANRVTSAHGGAVTRPRRRVRSHLAAVTGVLAVLIVTATLISVWAAVEIILGGATQSLLRVAAVVGVAAAAGAIAVVLVTQRQRAELALVAATAAGTVTLAVLGFSIWSLLAGLVVAAAVLWLTRSRAAPAGGATTAAQ